MRASLLAACGAMALALIGSTFAADTGPRRSGFDFMSPQTRAMQQDDSSNPAMLWVSDGESLWNRKVGAMCELEVVDLCHHMLTGVGARHVGAVEDLGHGQF